MMSTEQGSDDQFYKQKQLLPENFAEAVARNRHPEHVVAVNMVEGYDHSYYFVSQDLSKFTGALHGFDCYCNLPMQISSFATEHLNCEFTSQ